jgi:inositol transport system ATP-binding protein
MEKNYVLRVRNLTKSFPGVQAVSEVTVDIERGAVHALIGENGAGKSTFVKILAGFHAPDAGEILFNRARITLRDPHDALRRGISIIHQELLPFPELTVTENMFMGHELSYPFVGWLKKRAMHREAARVLERLGVRVSPLRKMRELRVAEMQAVEIAKALVHRSEIIIMDEPTSALSAPEVEALFGIIRDLKRQGVAVIYISHRLDEVFRIADVVTVLRDGRCAGTLETGKLNAAQLIALMVGRELAAGPPDTHPLPGSVALSVRGLARRAVFSGVDLDLHRGEILGIAGLMGAGRTDLACALSGLAPADGGEIRVNGRSVRISSPKDAIANGISMVSEDRREYGLVLNMSVKQNITLSSLRSCSRFFWVDRQRENRFVDDRILAFSIKTPGRDQKAAHLSGGNQQKIVIAKALSTEPDILILDEPTRGIDIGAKAEIHGMVRDLARAGKAVLLISSELPEILALSTRILVMREGRLTAELDPRRTTQDEIMKYAMPSPAARNSDALDG